MDTGRLRYKYTKKKEEIAMVSYNNGICKIANVDFLANKPVIKNTTLHIDKKGELKYAELFLN
jgi:hypothetical protein